MGNAIFFPFNTAALSAFVSNPAFQVIRDSKRGGYHVFPVMGIVSGNTGN